MNPEYEAWEVQDQTLLVWLQSILSKFVLSHGSNHSYQVWEKNHEYFSLHTKSMDEYYLRKIKGYVDELAGVGSSDSP